MSVSRSQIQKAATRFPWTKNFRHLLPVPKHWLDRQSFYDPGLKVVPVKDRIKYWNVVPGDQIRIRGEGSKLHEVMSINRFSNRVYLKGKIKEGSSTKMAVNRSVHYSRCQLFMGTHTLTTPLGGLKEISLFARRVGVRDPHWQPQIRRFDWKRIAIATTPAYFKKINRTPLVIPWPKHEFPERPAANQFYDTTKDAVLKITYQPPDLHKAVPADENAYINALFNPQPKTFDESKPMEFHLAKELSNPHGRAKKQARWQAAQGRKAEVLKKIVERELMNLKGRSAKAARAEGVFKFRQKMEEERKMEKKRRWFNAERVGKIERKVKRKQRKADKQKEKLTQLVLKEAANQVIPVAESPKRKRVPV
ncbi:hypothetical protein PAXINDRAFT_166253 [Paxillus involutus ATCC 200175]|nr:hypothetical protein PAXINDRAFT_166253 [Paxillus involutus ATCC 200175]